MKHAIYPVAKWCTRLSLLAALILPALYWSAWRCGIVKFACMQKVTPSMEAHWAFIASPLFGPAIDTAFGLSCLAIAFMVAELKYGPRTSAKIREAYQDVVARPYIWISLMGFIYLALFVSNPFLHRSGGSWLIVGVILILFVIFSKK